MLTLKKIPDIARKLVGVIFFLYFCLPVSAATKRVGVGDLSYTIDDVTMEAEVYGAAVSSIRNLVIPDEIIYEGVSYAVTSIRPLAFSLNKGVGGTLTLGENITSIGKSAFHNCSGFSGHLIIPDKVTTISEWAFAGCSGFTGSLTLGENVTTIAERAFAGCSGFTGSLVIPDKVTTLSVSAFRGCSGFTGSLTIGENVTTISDNAFQDCSGFTGSLTLGENVTTIGEWAFNDCSGFTGSLVIPNKVTTIGFRAFNGCSGFTGSLTIGENVTTIGRWAFQDCSGFTGGLIIPDKVTTIDQEAFWNCSGFSGTLTLSKSLTSIETGTFYGCAFTGLLQIPESVEVIKDHAFVNCQFSELEIGPNVKEIQTVAFGMATLNSVTCSAIVPPSCPDRVFVYNTYHEKPLYVPAESVGRYKTANVWKDFRYINPIAPEITKIGFEQDKITINVGETVELRVTAEPDGANLSQLSWSSQNPEIATVENGVVKAIKPGTVTITVMTANGLSASCEVTVLQPADGITIDFAASGIDGESLTLNVGESKTIVVDVTPAGSTDKLTWTVADATIASVDRDGKVTALKPGETTVIVTTESGKSATLKVTVLQPADGITIDFAASGIDGESLTLNVGESKTIVVEVTPAGSTDKLTWTVADATIASVDQNGKVTALKPGETTVTVTTESGKSATLKVTVLQPADGITIDFAASGIDGESLTLNVAESKTIVVNVTPATSTDKLSWTVADATVASVDQNGKVTALKPGETTVTVTTESGKSATLKVIVIQPVNGIVIDFSAMGISGNNLEMYVGDSKAIVVTFIPENASDKTLTFTSSDVTIAAVDGQGMINAKALGNSIITVTAVGGASATLNVNVIPTPVESITLNLLDATLKPGETVQLIATVLPENATDKTVVWSSVDPSIASVDANGLVNGLNIGSTIVSATSSNGLMADCRITVAHTEWPQPMASPCGTEYDTVDGATLDLFVTVEGGDENGWTYAWTAGNVNLGNNPSIQFEATNPGADKIVDIVNVVVRNTAEGEVIYEHTFTIKVNIYGAPVIADETGGINVEAPGVGAGTTTAGSAKVREGDALTISVEPGVGGYDNGWSYSWTMGGTAIGNGESVTTRASMTSGSEKGVETVVYSVNVTNVGPAGELWAEADLVAPVEVYRRPLTPAALQRKGDGTTHTLICMIDIDDSQLAPLGYSFVYGYESANGEETVIAETAKRYCRAPEAAFRNNNNRFWIYSVWNYGDGIVVTSGKRYLDGSIDENFTASVFDSTQATAGCSIDYTDSANWLKSDGKSVTVTIDSEYDTEIGIFATDGRCMRRLDIPAGTSLRQVVDVTDLVQGVYFVYVRSGKEVSTKKFIIK